MNILKKGQNMRKSEFLRTLENKLKKFNNSEVQRICEFYQELIVEKIDDGMSEEEAVASLGDINNIVNQVTADLIIERSQEKKPSPMKNFVIILGICASPILIPIGIALFSTFFAVFISMFAILISFSITAIALFISMFPFIIDIIRSGHDYYYALGTAGAMLLGCGILTLLSINVFQLGRYLLNSLLKFFSKMIKKKSEGAA